MSEHNIFLVIEQVANKWPGIMKFSQANCAKLLNLEVVNQLVYDYGNRYDR